MKPVQAPQLCAIAAISSPLFSPVVVLWLAASLPAQSQEPPPRPLNVVAYDTARARTVLFGGGVGPPYRDDTWEFDGDTWAQITPPVVPPARGGHALAYDAARAHTVMFGGLGSNLLADTWEFDGSQWQQIATMTAPSARKYFAFAYDTARQRTVLFGGYDAQGVVGDTWEYDGANWVQVATATAPAPRWSATMVFDPVRSCMVLFGGVGASAQYADTWQYDGHTWQQITVPVSPPARYFQAMLHDSARCRTVLSGGLAPPGVLLDDVWEFDGAAWTRAATNLPSARYGHAMAYEPVPGRRVLIGGTDGTSALGGTWECDVGDWQEVQLRVQFQTQFHWQQLQPAAAPSPRAGHAMVHDSARHRTVLFGGSGFGPPAFDTWEFDGANWHQVTTTHAPAASGKAVFDPARNQMVLVTLDPSTAVFQTWEYDGVDWTLHQTATVPPGNGPMAYDSVRARTVLLTDTAETWEYDGLDWILAQTNAPTLYDKALAYDATRHRTVLVGVGASSVETWEYDGAAWMQIATPHTPLTATGQAMCFDSRRNRVILVGIIYIFGGLGGTWEYDGADWVELVNWSTSGSRVHAHAGLVFDPLHAQPLVFGGMIPGGKGWPFPTFNNDTLRLQPPIPPSPTWTRHGLGCAGSAGMPSLDNFGSTLPARGSLFAMQVTGLPPTNGIVFLSFGLGISRWNGHALPLRLDALGLPACKMWIEPEVGVSVMLPNLGGQVLYGLRIPNTPSFAGQVFSTQAAVLDPRAASGIDSVSNGGIMQVR